jgi:hypothetical protein
MGNESGRVQTCHLLNCRCQTAGDVRYEKVDHDDASVLSHQL